MPWRPLPQFWGQSSAIQASAGFFLLDCRGENLLRARLLPVAAGKTGHSQAVPSALGMTGFPMCLCVCALGFKAHRLTQAGHVLRS